MEQNVSVQELEPKITEKKLWNLHHLFLAFFIGLGLVILTLFINTLLDLSLIHSIILASLVIIIYAVILFFLLEPKILRQVERTTLQTVEKPVIKEVPVERKVFVDRPVIKEVQVPVEKEVIKEVQVPVERKVFVPVEKPRKSINIPKYDFIASTETKVYHKRNCRLGKLIKRKYRLSDNLESVFIKKGFRPCKVCITKQKKV